MADPRFTLPPDAKTRLYRGRVVAPFIGLRARPKFSAPIDTELLYGQGFDVHAEQGTFVLGRVRPLISSKRKAYIGYVPRKAVSEDAPRTAHIVSAVSAPIFARADIKSPIKTTLPMNAIVRAEKPVETQNGALHEIDGLGFIHARHLRCKRTPPPEDYVEVAAQFLGRPYIWGGTGGMGVDCSGLVQMALAATEIDTPRDADQQEKHLGAPIGLKDLQRGDLVFWPGHVGIMESDKIMLHANAHHMMTAREPLKKAIQRIGPPRTLKRL